MAGCQVGSGGQLDQRHCSAEGIPGRPRRAGAVFAPTIAGLAHFWPCRPSFRFCHHRLPLVRYRPRQFPKDRYLQTHHTLRRCGELCEVVQRPAVCQRVPRVNLQYGLIVLLFATVFGLMFALLLNEKFPGRGFFRAILILPWALPWVIIGLLWGWVVDAQFGLLNGLYQFGIIPKYVAFLAKDGWALFFTALATVWRQASFSGILFLAAPAGHPPGPV